jgi:hypothetical protein
MRSRMPVVVALATSMAALVLALAGCATTGARYKDPAAFAAKTLADLGYTRVVDFGGVSRWKGELVTAPTSG